jgi:hypothetical protein
VSGECLVEVPRVRNEGVTRIRADGVPRVMYPGLPPRIIRREDVPGIVWLGYRIERLRSPLLPRLGTPVNDRNRLESERIDLDSA